MSRTAVCLSGQPRTIKHCAKSIMEYFGDVDYFCHAWDYNDYKVKNKETGVLEFQHEQLVYEEVLESIKIFKPLNYMIESVAALGTNRFNWDSLLYSHLMAVNMKKQWEIKHNFRYDWVVKGRYDLVYPHGKKFRLSERTTMRDCREYYPNLDLFTAHLARIPCEFLQINISDIAYYGSSVAMDVAADLYWHCQREYANTKTEIKRLGPGTWMSDYIATNNLRFYEDNKNLTEVILRNAAIGYSVEHDWNDIAMIHGDIYK